MQAQSDSQLTVQLETIHTNYMESYRRHRQYASDAAMWIHQTRQKLSKSLEGMTNLSGLRAQYKGQTRFPPKDGATLLTGNILEALLASNTSHPDILYETTFVYAFALLDAFLRDVFGILLTCHPELLDKTIRRKKNHLRDLVEDDVRNLDSGSIAQRVTTYKNRFDVDILSFSDARITTVETLAFWREKRNCLVHRNGIIDVRLTNKDLEKKLKEGSRLKIRYTDWEMVLDVFARIVNSVVYQLNKRYGALPLKLSGWN